MITSLKAALATASLAFLSFTAHAVTAIGTPPPGTYNFSGTCLDCDEVPTPATATLVIGETWSFTYESNLFSLVSDWVEVADLGVIDGEGNADSNILFGANEATWHFTSNLAGSWSLNNLSIASDNEDFGRNGVWAPGNGVPEPATYALLALGIAAAARRRRQTSV